MTEEQAVEQAKQLAQRLGGGWRIHVSKAFSYHYSCMWRHTLRVTPTEDGRFQAYIRSGKKYDNWATAQGDTPKQALLALLTRAKNKMTKLHQRNAYHRALNKVQRVPDEEKNGG